MSTNGGPVDQKLNAAAETGAAGRDASGRFVAGNAGGPGNPYARRVGELRRAMLAAVTEDDLAAIMQAMIEKAKEGNVQAAKVVLAYAVGKPEAAADPDRGDAHEWELQKETAAMMAGMADVVKAPPAEVPLRTARILRPLMGSILSQKMADMLLHPDEHFPHLRTDDEAETDEGEPSANGIFPESAELRKGAEELLELLGRRGYRQQTEKAPKAEARNGKQGVPSA